MTDPKTPEELKNVIKCIHKLWYDDPFKSREDAYQLHQHLGELFNYAGITETLVKNNPGKTTPEEFLRN